MNIERATARYKSGANNVYRAAKLWPTFGFGDVSMPAALVPLLILCIFIGGKVPIIWWIFYIYVGSLLLSKLLGVKPGRLVATVVSRRRYTGAVSRWKRCVTGLALTVFAFAPDKVNATFEIVIPSESPSQEKFEPRSHYKGNAILSAGFAREISLNDALALMLPAPWRVNYWSEELKDLKVSYNYEGSILTFAFLADLSRRYGVEVAQHQNAGLYHIRWDRGKCAGEKNEVRMQIAKNAEYFGAGRAKLPPYLVLESDDETGYIVIC